MKVPLVSIIVVTYNSAPYLTSCLKALKQVDYESLELCIVDNHSSDDSVFLVKKITKNWPYPVHITVNTKNEGYAAANNKAIAQAHGSYIFVLNPDGEVTPHFLKPLVAAVQQHTSIAACQPAVYLSKNRSKLNLTGKTTHYLGFDWIRDFGKKTPPPANTIDSFSGSGVLLRKKVFEKLGGFDEAYFMYFEDSDLSWRMRLAGYTIEFAPQTVLYHDYKYIPLKSYQSLKKKLYLAERNRLLTIFKNYSTKTIILLLPIIGVIECSMVVYAFLQGWGIYKLKSYVSIWQLRKHIAEQRAILSKLRKLTDTQVAKNFVSRLTFKEFAHPIVVHILNPIMAGYWALIKPLL